MTRPRPPRPPITVYDPDALVVELHATDLRPVPSADVDRPPPPPRPTRRACSTCRFHDPASGTCRRHAPSLDDDTGRGRWPTVDADDWCGRHEPRP